MRNRLLLVDPEPNFRRSLAIGLRQNGCEVVEATSYSEAKTLLRENVFDGLILDIEPVFLDWQGVIESAAFNQPGIRIVFTSAFNYSEMYPFLLEWGEKPFFVKPFDGSEVVGFFQSEAVA